VHANPRVHWAIRSSLRVVVSCDTELLYGIDDTVQSVLDFHGRRRGVGSASWECGSDVTVV